MWLPIVLVLVGASGVLSTECQDGLVVPAWRPLGPLSLWDRCLRGTVYFLILAYLFIGVSIISDRFMSAIEVITSQERRVTIRSKGENKTILVRVWNETVANLTLMALGSSAPEILLSIIEIYGKNFEAGDLGPGTIVGSAAYNLFVIIAICVLVIPDGESRKIKHLQVFLVTSTWSIFAYVWLFLILDVFSKNVVEVWEGLLTFIFFPLTVYTAYLADRKIPIHKIPSMICGFKSRRAVGAAERIDIELNRSDEGFEEILEQARQQSANVLKELRLLHPDKPLAEIKALAQERLEQTGPKSRAFYRIQATRSLTGGSVIYRQTREPSIQEDRESIVDVFTDTAYVRFEQSEYVVLENVGTIIVRVVVEGPGLGVPLLVDYQSEDGTANAGSDYMAVSGTLLFKQGQTEQFFKVKIIDDDVFEEDEHFFIKLSNVRLQLARGGSASVRLGEPSITKITILDDDHSGVFGFRDKVVHVAENEEKVEMVVERRTGARGRVRVGFWTQDGTAKAGKDYTAMSGTLLFDNNQSRNTIVIPIMSENSYQKNVEFTIHLEKPLVEICEDTIRASFRLKSNRTEEEEKIAKQGFPRLGENPISTIVIRESAEFKETVDELAERHASPVAMSNKSWGQQFSAAFRVKEDEEEATRFDYFMHVLTIFWKLLFAFVPPTELCCGYVCFTLSIVWIGVLTAVIGDIASHFGCTIGLHDSITAITFVALGTSVPDTFASKVAAVQDSTADNSIGNVTGSNAVNVFLGIGIAWSLAAIHHAVRGTTFVVPSGNLAFSVTVFCSEAVIAIMLILLRRTKAIGGELGGPSSFKYATGLFFCLLWVLYITLSILEVYGCL